MRKQTSQLPPARYYHMCDYSSLRVIYRWRCMVCGELFKRHPYAKTCKGGDKSGAANA